MTIHGRDRRRRGLVNRARRWLYGLMLGLGAHGAVHADETVPLAHLGSLHAVLRLPSTEGRDALVAPALADYAGTTVYGDLLPRTPSRMLAEPQILFANPLSDPILLVAQGSGWAFGSAVHFGRPGAGDAGALAIEPVFIVPFDGVVQLPFDAELVLHYGRWRGDTGKNAGDERMAQATLGWRF